ncbi:MULTISPECIES: polysaccharide biosynthesis tyrosine autokinase [unclassified Nostoc]|uniref:GumC family protein n=1 Tax=unclassified Nostoc TaxID=2593658 RepID=UPI002AD50A45|nr:polysaccharide biosynthesis tyrosine autokinase [Nostoc sp. DedQUE03]MDZ7973940.1 polysaccharide biosynthesis tyrosine autokinase [Nostoc sp. DedQUE03]MDZ8049791.1 polysaccharide biosynthesis tyrosine autokinase [Nostoc sp. DedQUE02]
MAKTSLNQEQQVTTSAQGVVDIRQLSTILLRRRFLILGVSCVVMSVASLLAVTVKPTYQSNMQILVSSNSSEGAQSNNIPVGADTQVTDSNSQVVDSTTQMKLMLSSKLLQKAVDLLHSDYPNITLQDINGQKGHQTKAALEITPEEGGIGANKVFNQAFKVSFNDDDPIKAQKVLQALEKVYQNYNKQQQKERLNQGLAFVNTRLPEIKKEVSKAEKNLEQFRKKHKLLDPEVQSKILLESLADVQQQLQTARANLKDVNARYDNLEQQIASSSQQNTLISSRLNQSSRYQALLSEIQKTELALAKERLRYTDDYPSVQKLKQQRQSELSLLREEVKTITNSKEKPLFKGQILGVDPTLLDEFVLVQTTVLGLTANEKNLTESEQQIRSELNKYPSLIAEYNSLLPKVETSRKTLEQLLQAQQSLGLKIAQEGYSWQVLAEPSPGIYMGNNRLLLLVGGAVIGPILGILAALILEKFNDAIYCAGDLKKLTNLRVLGSVPKLSSRSAKKRRLGLPWNGRGSSDSVIEASTKLPVHETLDMIYQNIQILKYPLPFKSLMFTSALPGEGKTTLVLGLVASATRMHRRVLVIDANLHNPSLHKILEISNDWGLSLLLVDETTTHFQDYIQPIHPSIDILTAGPEPEDTVKLLSSQRMKELIELFEQSYDLVLIDAPPILGTVDARIVASFCNGIVMVERMGKVTRTELTQATEILSKLNLIGIIANEVSNSQKVLAS